MPEVQPDAFIVTDERTRALLTALLDRWSSPAAVALFRLVGRRIEIRAAEQAQAAKRSFATTEAYLELLDRAGSIFIERLGATVNDALCDLADASVDAAIEELPSPKRKRDRSGTVRHKHVAVLVKTIAYVFAILDAGESILSQSFVAALYYWQYDIDSGAIAEAYQKYCDLSQGQKDRRLRAYRKLLQSKGFDFDGIVASARRIHADTIPVSEGK